MALHLIGSKAANSLPCLAAWSTVLSASDVAAIDGSITNDGAFGAVTGRAETGPTAMIGTGNTHSNTTLDTLVSVSGAPVSQIQVGDIVFGPGIPTETFVQAVSGGGTSITLSKAATATTAGINVAIVRNPATQPYGLSQGGLLTIPHRGFLKVLPGDVVALDPAIGFPYLIPANAINIAGSIWTFA